MTATTALLANALDIACTAVAHPRAGQLLHDYYDPAGDYAGATFTHLAPNPPGDITATDLYALSLLDVQAGPRAGRRLLEPGEHRSRVVEALSASALPGGADLTTAGPGTWAAAETLYLAVRDALGARPWVTASKLCARKRPRFFPVRDNVVTRLVLGGGTDYLVDWEMYRHLLRDRDLAAGLTNVVSQAHALPGDITIDDPPIRVLDIVLWMTAPTEVRRR